MYIDNVLSKTSHDNILLYHLDRGAIAKTLEIINDKIKNKTYLTHLEYMAYILDYNLITSKRITTKEHIAVDIILLDYSEETGEIIKPTLEAKFLEYKIKFIDKR